MIKKKQNIKKPILLNNFVIKVQNRYIDTENQKKKREWFTTNLEFVFENDDYYIKEAIIKFDHIDDDNPEFFLQPGQFIKVFNGKLKFCENCNEKNILIIDKFQQEYER
ncbi:hypothetical protein LFWB_6970 [Candidatus Phytoplasma luffae]|uniref:Uncharacterized protein n=1 Tax=Loofah witches'-broom phytoplasma TaxID=35773 RepID=A0A975FJP0_LOWBP|nr:hypothetical protein [Candidatus Phytoplasma luffae]QTX03250.1 hypothetical protein LFWB_6970 [Candidatus Phytoplasma luffae]